MAYKNTLKNKTTRVGKQGRTMLEMLGVLAIMAVLAFGAAAGLRYALDKNTANNVAKEAMRQAVELKNRRHAYTKSDGEIRYNYDSEYITSRTYQDEGKTIIWLKATNIKKGVCEKVIDNQKGSDFFTFVLVDGTTETCGDSNTVVFAFDTRGQKSRTIIQPDLCRSIQKTTDCRIAQNQTDANNCVTVQKITCPSGSKCDANSGVCIACTIPSCGSDTCCELTGPKDECGNPTPQRKENCPCETATDCDTTSGEVCVNKLCTKSSGNSCSTDTNCLSSEICKNGICKICPSCSDAGCGENSCSNLCTLDEDGCAVQCGGVSCPPNTSLTEISNGVCVCMGTVCGENRFGQSGAQSSLVCCGITYMKNTCGENDEPSQHVWVGDGFASGNGSTNYCCCNKNSSEECCQAAKGANYHIINGVCDECPNGATYNPATQTCIECNSDADCAQNPYGNKCYNNVCYCVWDEYTYSDAPRCNGTTQTCMVVKQMDGSDYTYEQQRAMCAGCATDERLLSKYVSGPDKSAAVCCSQTLTRCCMVSTCSSPESMPYCHMPLGNGTICTSSGETCPSGTKTECGGLVFPN